MSSCKSCTQPMSLQHSRKPRDVTGPTGQPGYVRVSALNGTTRHTPSIWRRSKSAVGIC
jgi:hypothetical protein